MAIRIDEYGHIIRDEEPVQTNSSAVHNITESASEVDQLFIPDGASALNYLGASQLGSGSNILLETSVPWYGGDGAFWTITLILALSVAFFASTVIAPIVFETSSSSSDILDGITNFLFKIAPYAIFVGTFVGCIWYNAKGTKTKTSYHTAGEYFLSPLCSMAGAVGVGVIIFLLALAVYIIAAIIAIAIVIGVLVGLFSGG